MSEVRITRAALVAAHCCQLERFEASPRWQGDAWVLPGGATDAELDRLATEAPESLIWLTWHKLLPVSREQVRAALRRAAEGPTGAAVRAAVAGRVNEAKAGPGSPRKAALMLKALAALDNARGIRPRADAPARDVVTS